MRPTTTSSLDDCTPARCIGRADTALRQVIVNKEACQFLVSVRPLAFSSLGYFHFHQIGPLSPKAGIETGAS